MVNEIINKEAKKIKFEVKNKVLGYMVGAFGLVAAFAWNDAVKSLIEYLFPIGKNTLTMKFLYAIILTLIIAVVTMYITRLLKSEAEDK
jgi:hypothetical protein